MEALAQPTAATYLKVKCAEGEDRPSEGGQFVFAVKFDIEDNAVQVSTRPQQSRPPRVPPRPLGITFREPPKRGAKTPMQQFFAICTTGIATVRLTKSTAGSASVGTYLYCDPDTGDILTDALLAGRPRSPPLPPVAMVLECRPLEQLARVLLLAHAAAG